jgi:hypothetical protein
MTPTKTAPPAEQEAAFDAAQFDDPALKLEYVDGKKVDKISVRFAGTVELTRSNPEHVALYRRLALGKEIDFADMPQLSGMVTNKPNRQVRDGNGYVSDVHQTAVVTITDIGGFAGAATTASEPDDDDGEAE